MKCILLKSLSTNLHFVFWHNLRLTGKLQKQWKEFPLFKIPNNSYITMLALYYHSVTVSPRMQTIILFNIFFSAIWEYIADVMLFTPKYFLVCTYEKQGNSQPPLKIRM